MLSYMYCLYVLLLQRAGWWNYELCINGEIKQFHSNEKVRRPAFVSLLS